MKNTKITMFSRTATLFAAAFLLAYSLANARAQDVPDISLLYNKAVQLADRQKNYAGALEVADEIITRFGDHAEEDFGAQFGTIYYLKGICLFHLKNYPEAYDNFETCHNKFPNTLQPTEAPTKAKVNNKQWKRAVYYMGACKQKTEEWEEAIKIYDKFKSHRPERGEYDPATLEINISTCYIKSEKVKKGQTILERVYKNKEKLRAKPTALYAGFLVLLGGWVEKGDTVLNDASRFLDTYMEDLRLSPYDIARFKFNWQTYKLAKDISAAGMEGVALRILGLVPETRSVISDLEDRREAFSKRNEKLEKEIVVYQKEIDDGDPVDTYSLLEEARALELRGDLRGGFAIYDHLAYNFQKSKHRPEILYNATRSAALIGDMITVQHHGLTFLKQYPTHKLKEQVSALLLEQLFFNGEYERCLVIAADLRKGKKVGSLERDLPDFAYGGSLFYLGRYGDAQAEVDSHVENYPNSRYREHSLYHQAGNLVKLFKYPLALRKLDWFLENYEGSPLEDLVLYDKATCHYGMNQLEECLKVVALLQTKHPDSPVFDRSLILKGDVSQLKEEFDKARGLYEEARTTAQDQRHDDTDENALFQLIAVAVAQERWDDAVALYDEFIGLYPGGFFEPNVIVTAMPALEEKGRAEEALGKLEKVIIQLGERYDVAQLERALASFARIFSDKNGPLALVRKLERFPGVPIGNNMLKAWLAVTRLNVLEDDANKKHFDNLPAEINQAYIDLMKLPRGDLSNYIIVKVGQNLMAREGKEFEAIEWFEEVLGRSNPALKDFATLGIAQIKGKSNSEKIQNEAVDLFRQVIQVFKTPPLQGDAHLGLARLLFGQKKWREALDESLLTYMNNKEWRTSRAEISWMLGRSYEALGDSEKALPAYVNVYFLYPGELDYSTDAYRRTAQIQYKGGHKEKAYKTLTRMLLTMGHLKDPTNNIAKARTLHLAWAGELGKNAEEDISRERKR